MPISYVKNNWIFIVNNVDYILNIVLLASRDVNLVNFDVLFYRKGSEIYYTWSPKGDGIITIWDSTCTIGWDYVSQIDYKWDNIGGAHIENWDHNEIKPIKGLFERFDTMIFAPSIMQRKMVSPTTYILSLNKSLNGITPEYVINVNKW